MMGRRERGQGQFFYAFDLDKVVPTDHLVRQIDGVLDLDWVHKELAPYLSLPKIRSVWIRSMSQNHRIIRADVCDPEHLQDPSLSTFSSRDAGWKPRICFFIISLTLH
jgi:hypothetical protein